MNFWQKRDLRTIAVHYFYFIFRKHKEPEMIDNLIPKWSPCLLVVCSERFKSSCPPSRSSSSVRQPERKRNFYYLNNFEINENFEVTSKWTHTPHLRASPHINHVIKRVIDLSLGDFASSIQQEQYVNGNSQLDKMKEAELGTEDVWWKERAQFKCTIRNWFVRW